MSNLDLTMDVSLSRRNAAKMLGVCLTVLDRLKIPNIRVGKRVLYRRSILLAWLEEQERKQRTQQDLAQYQKLLEDSKKYESLTSAMALAEAASMLTKKGA